MVLLLPDVPCPLFSLFLTVDSCTLTFTVARDACRCFIAKPGLLETLVVIQADGGFQADFVGAVCSQKIASPRLPIFVVVDN